MKAIRKIEPRPGIVVQEVEEPKIGPSQVLVEIKATAICGSDLHIYRWDEQTTRWKTPLPMTVGHEFSGKVVEVGKEVKSIRLGDNVAGESHIPCGICYYCRTGNMHICQDMLIFGLQTKEGSFAKYAAVPEVIAYKLPPGVSYEEGALLEPFGVAVHAIERTGIQLGDVVLVMGVGPIGIFAQQVAKASGASMVIAVGRRTFRLDLARRIGSADVFLSTEEDDIVKRTMELTNGEGADVVIELAGSPRTIRQSFQALRKTGRVGLVGLPEKPVEIEATSMIIYKEATVFGSTGRLMFGTWERMARLVSSKRVNLTGVITDRLPLDNAEKGFQRVLKGQSGKVLFTP
ncbi:MAG: alcohol dehydrogenase catalytic domain-containing protein [Candidatus Bathyarchaeia archaeon]